MGKGFSSHSHPVSIAHYISNKVSGLIRPLHAQVQSEMMQNSEFKVALEDKMRKERLQNTLAEWRRMAGLTSAQVAKAMG